MGFLFFTTHARLKTLIIFLSVIKFVVNYNMANSAFQAFRNASIAKKLYFTVGIMAMLIALELLTLWFANSTLSSVRAFINGEGLWSKAEKDAVNALHRYARTGKEADYQQFSEFMKVPLGDHKTRLELVKPHPDMNIAREGFLEGRNNPDDVAGMIKLFTRFYFVSYIHKAIVIWTAADSVGAPMVAIGRQIHDEVSMAGSNSNSKAQVELLLNQLDDINANLTVLEDDFSFTLGEGARWMENLVLRILFSVALTVEISGLLLTISVSRNIQRGLNEIIRAAKAIGTGDLNARAKSFSHDEIGILADAFNEMTAQYEHSIDVRKKGEDKFRELLESAPDAIVIADKDGVIQLVNAQTERMFEFKRDEMIGQKVEMLIPANFVGRHAQHRQQFFGDPKARSMGIGLELFGRRKSGEEFAVEISLSPLKVEEGTWVAAAVRDITAKKKVEEDLKDYARKLEQSNSSLEQFAYVASHDLQEPLRNITNFTTLLEQHERDRLDPTSSRYLQFIVGGAERMKILIKDLLLYSRLGRQHIVELVNFNEVLSGVLADMSLLIKENEAVIKSGHLPVLPMGKTEVKLLLQNLISNAIKYRKATETPVIEINSEKLSNGTWRFSVKDNGIGIEEQFKDRIFIIFQRLHNQDEYSGTGIGLATCKKVVELNGGAIWVESKPGVGSVFYFTFPRNDIKMNGV